MIDWATWNVACKPLHAYIELDCELDLIFLQEVGSQPDGTFLSRPLVTFGPSLVALMEAAGHRPFCFVNNIFLEFSNSTFWDKSFGASLSM